MTAPLPYNLSGTPLLSSQPSVQASGPASVPDSPLQSAPPPTTPQATPQQQYPSSPTEAEFIAGFTQQQQTIDEEDDDIAFHNVSEVEPTDDEPAAEPTTTPSGEQVVEQLQKSMAKASDLVAKTAAAVDASAKETTELRETVGTTTKALQALVDAKNKTENASPATKRGGAAAAASAPQHGRICHSAIASISATFCAHARVAGAKRL